MNVKELRDILKTFDDTQRVFVAEDRVGETFHRPLQVFETEDGDVGFTVSALSYARPESNDSKRDTLVEVEE